MIDYISREDAKLHIFEYGVRHRDNGSIASACENLERQMNSIPAADVRPVVRAIWRRYSPFTDTYECSNCGEQVIDQQFRTNFCPNCGAAMRET